MEIYGAYTGATAGSIVFGNLDVIDVSPDCDYGFNLSAFGLKGDSATGKIAQVLSLLDSINKIDTDHAFYYNSVMDESNAIDFKSVLNDYEYTEQNLANPKIWYDPNNANNKFVISEIDAKALKTGLRIARTSKQR